MKKVAVLIAAVMALYLPVLAAPVKMIPASFKDIADTVRPSVVNISTVQVMRQSMNPYYGFEDEVYERFFGVPRGTFKRSSLGSGFIMNKNGYIITNNHVVSKADEITVRLYDRREFKAKVVGTDADTDLAVIKIEANGLVPLPLGNSDSANVGDWVLAVGSPFGLEQTVTQGIISAKGRIIGAGPYDDFLQTDAAINPGNSGGPLVNLEGEAVGINTAISSTSGGYEGVGFAIPVNMAKKITADIINKGKVIRGWLGVGIQEITPELAEHFKVKDGVLIAQVFRDGPAEKAGIQRGDVIVEFDGKEVKKHRELQAVVAATDINKKVKVKIIRQGKARYAEVSVAEREMGSMSEAPQYVSDDASCGITAGDITDEVKRQYGLKDRSGVIVLDLAQGSAAAESGVMRGDIIHEVNGKVVKGLKEFEEEISKLKQGSRAVFVIERGDSMIYLAFMVK